MNLIIVGNSAKSWVSSLDIAANSWKIYRESSLLFHCGFLKRFQMRSVRGRNFEAKILEEAHSNSLSSRVRLRNVLLATKIAYVLSRKRDLIELRSYYVRDLQLGEIIYSRLCASMHSSFFKIQDVKLFQLLRYVFEAISGFENAKKLFEVYPVSQVYVYNGREPLEAAFIAAARIFKVKVFIIERGCDSGHYEIYSKSPHLSDEWWEKLREFSAMYPEARDRYLDERSENYAKTKAQGFDIWENRSWKMLMDGDNSNDKASFVDPFIVFYSSSSKEVSPFAEFQDITDFETQFQAVEELISVAKELKLNVIIRRHPNSMAPSRIDREQILWEKFKNIPNVTYLPPTDKTNSYELMKDARAVFVWISTIGFDAMVHRKPVYALGAARWDFEGNRRVWNRKDIKESLRPGGEQRKDELYVYANYMSHYGTKISICKLCNRAGAVLETGELIPWRIKDAIRARVKKSK